MPPTPILPLDLASDQVDLKLLCRRLAQIEVQLQRIADTASLELKFKLIQTNVPISALREAEEDLQPPVGGKPPVEVLNQTSQEIADLNEAWERVEERLGKGRVPADLDLYAEVAKHREGEPGEEP